MRFKASGTLIALATLALATSEASAQAPAPWAPTPAAAANTSDPIVAVTGGRVQGRKLATGGAVFKGIPFAAPPVGPLRWREPQPVAAWSGVRQAGDYGHACVQPDSGWNKLAASISSEDCLYLNVWTPAGPISAKKPVMVWIHGGGNNGGSALGAGGIEPPFDGASLARHGVLVVTLNYRLGLFGFLGHPELTAESPHHASGSYAILDQIAALQWVHDNIARFGGDPANVTLFGQSAGAQDTTLVVSSPLSKGLLQKAIAESGTPMVGDKRLQTRAQAEQMGVIFGQTVKAPPTGTIAYLRNLPVAQLLAALPDFRKSLSDAKLVLDANQDGYALPQFSPNVYRLGREPRVPMIIGTNGRDTPGYRPAGDTPEAIQAAVRTRVTDIYAAYPDLQARALAAYGVGGSGSGPANPANPGYGPLDMQAAVDHGFRCEGTALAKWHSAVAPVWHYEFTAGTAAHPPMHSGELDFVFGYLRDQGADPVLAKLSEQMQTYWTNFAKTGDPNGAGLPQWPRYDAAQRTYLEFGNGGPVTKANLRDTMCDIYTERLTRDIASR